MALIVYGGAVSPFVRKVRVVLMEKGVDYTLEQVSPFNPPATIGALPRSTRQPPPARTARRPVETRRLMPARTPRRTLK